MISVNREIVHTVEMLSKSDLCNTVLLNAIYALAKCEAKAPRQLGKLSINTLITVRKKLS